MVYFLLRRSVIDFGREDVTQDYLHRDECYSMEH